MNQHLESSSSSFPRLIHLGVNAVPVLAHRFRISSSSLAAALLLLLTWALVAQGHAPSRWAQLLLLALPGILLIIVPIANKHLSLFRNAAVFVWVSAFALDGVVRAFLTAAYQASPDSSLVIGAVANTNMRESTEFLRMLSPTALLWAATLPFTLVATFFLVIHGSRQGNRPRRIVVLGLIAFLTLSTLSYVFKAPRRLHPLVFWSGWTQTVQSTRASWAQMEAKRQQIQLFADQLQPKLDTKGKSTVVLVISDSVNRDNLGLYGYARATTPDLTNLKGQLGDNMLVLKNAWSVEASTLPALNKIFMLNCVES